MRTEARVQKCERPILVVNNYRLMKHSDCRITTSEYMRKSGGLPGSFEPHMIGWRDTVKAI